MFTYSQNLNYEKDFHCAWKLVADVNGKKLSDAFGVLAWNNTGYGNYYFRSNCLNRIVALGCSYSINDTMHHATEVQYDFLNKNKGIAGYPLFWKFGGMYNFSGGVNWHLNLHAGQNLIMT